MTLKKNEEEDENDDEYAGCAAVSVTPQVRNPLAQAAATNSDVKEGQP